MNPVENPFSPGAGTQPPELAGRDELVRYMDISLQRVIMSLPSKSVLMVGLRGVGKTVLLDHLRGRAEELGAQTIRIEAPERRSLPAMLAPQLRQALYRLSRNEKAGELAQRTLKALAGFVKGLKLKYQDIELSYDIEPEPGLADSGDLEFDLITLMECAGQAAKSANSALILFIDELQYVKEEELASLISSMHRMSQQRLPVCMVGAGLPQLRGKMGKAKSYAERLFEFPVIGPLDEESARLAIYKPLHDAGVKIEDAALDLIVKETKAYPYFLQEWGKHSWDVAETSPIRVEDVLFASRCAIDTLDESFFRVRFDRLTPLERRYLRAMAELGPLPQRSGDIAELLKRPVTSLGPTRNNLISKGMIWSPQHGDTAFTVPLFDEFMKRVIPGDNWRDE